MMSEIKIGDRIVVLRGMWKAHTMTVKHVSRNGRKVFTDYADGLRFRRRDVEPIIIKKAGLGDE